MIESEKARLIRREWEEPQEKIKERQKKWKIVCSAQENVA